jgi:hypothetical protein
VFGLALYGPLAACAQLRWRVDARLPILGEGEYRAALKARAQVFSIDNAADRYLRLLFSHAPAGRVA